MMYLDICLKTGVWRVRMEGIFYLIEMILVGASYLKIGISFGQIGEWDKGGISCESKAVSFTEPQNPQGYWWENCVDAKLFKCAFKQRN